MASSPATSGGLDRAIGRLEGRFDSLDVRLVAMDKNFTEQLHSHDKNSRTGLEALRQDVVHANTEIRNRMEDIAEEARNGLHALETRIGAVETAGTTKARIIDLAFKAIPFFVGGGGLAAFVLAGMK